LLLKFALELAVEKIQEKQEELKLNRTRKFLVCAENNLVDKNVNTMKKVRSLLKSRYREEQVIYISEYCQQNS
jgi:hypothetical protein